MEESDPDGKKEKLGEKLWSRSPQGEWEILTGARKGGTHHSKNLEEETVRCCLRKQEWGNGIT